VKEYSHCLWKAQGHLERKAWDFVHSRPLQMVSFGHPEASWKLERALEGSNSIATLLEAKSS